MLNITKLNQELKQQISKHLSIKQITGTEIKSAIENDNMSVVENRKAGDVVINFDENVVLVMTEVEGNPVISLDSFICDKQHLPLFIEILTVCQKYLP